MMKTTSDDRSETFTSENKQNEENYMFSWEKELTKVNQMMKTSTVGLETLTFKNKLN